MTLPTTFIIAFQGMVLVLFRQRLAIYKKQDDFIKQIFIKSTFTGEFQISLVLGGDT